MKGFVRFLVRKSLLGRTVIPTPIDEKRGPFLSSFRAIYSSAMRSHTPISYLNPWKPASFLPPNSGLWGSFNGLWFYFNLPLCDFFPYRICYKDFCFKFLNIRMNPFPIHCSRGTSFCAKNCFLPLVVVVIMVEISV